MSETKVFHQLQLMYNLKQDVDYIVRQLNQQNRLISRMRRFQRYCKDFLEGTNQIGLKRLDLEYTKFDRDYRHLNRSCQKMKQKMHASLIYDKISNLFVSLSEDLVEIDGGDGDGQDVSVNDNMADEDNVDENDNYSGYNDSDQSVELDGGEFDEDNFDVSFVEKKRGRPRTSDTVFVDAQQSTPINEIVEGLENVAVVTNGNKSDESREILKLCGIEGCQFVTKYNSNLSRHKMSIHKKSVKPAKKKKKTSTQTQPKQTSKQQALFRCNLSADCTYVTDQSKSLKHHQWIHSAKQLYCDYDGCDFHTIKPGTLVYHQRRIHNMLHSGFTSKQLTNITRQDSANKSENSSTSAKKTSTQTQPKQTLKQQAIYRCDLSADCSYVTDQLSYLKQHQQIHTSQEIKCDYDGCDYLATLTRNMVSHQKRVHNRFICGYRECHFVGRRESDLKAHRTKIHKDSEKEYRCSVGGCKFVSRKRNDMLCHQTIHIAKTNSKMSLTSPPSTSNSPPPSKVLQCSYPGCDFSANRQYKLLHHLVIHNPFKCSHRGCNYAGKRLPDLKVHQTKMHSGEKGD